MILISQGSELMNQVNTKIRIKVAIKRILWEWKSGIALFLLQNTEITANQQARTNALKSWSQSSLHHRILQVDD